MSWKVWNSGLDFWHMQHDIFAFKTSMNTLGHIFLLGIDGSFRKVKIFGV
jgi:hypothetical protein